MSNTSESLIKYKRLPTKDDTLTRDDFEKNLYSKALLEPVGNAILRDASGSANWVDNAGTDVAAVFQMFMKATSAADPNCVTADQLNTYANYLSLVGAWGFFFSNFFHFLRILLFGSGKEQRLGKMLYDLLGICGPLIAACSLGVTVAAAGWVAILGSIGFTVGLLALPVFGIYINAVIPMRNIPKLIRTYKGTHPEGLKKQKFEKIKLAEKAGNKKRAVRFHIELAALELFLSSEFIKTREDLENNEYFNNVKGRSQLESKQDELAFFRLFKNKMNSLNIEEKSKKQIQQELNSFFNKDAELTSLAKKYGASLMAGQLFKFDIRKKFIITSTTLCTLFIAISILGLLVLLGSLFPAGFPALVVALTALKLIGAGLGVGVLGCMATFLGLSIKLSADQYNGWKETFDKFKKENDGWMKKYGNNSHYSYQKEQRETLMRAWVALMDDERKSFALRTAGITTMVVSGLLMSTALLPFVNIGALAFVGAGLIAAGLVIFSIGAYKAYQVRKQEKAIAAMEDPSKKDDFPVGVSLVALNTPQPRVDHRSELSQSAAAAAGADHNSGVPHVKLEFFVKGLPEGYQPKLKNSPDPQSTEDKRPTPIAP